MYVYLALVGACLSMISNIPQVFKVRNRNSTNDLHACTIILHLFSAIIWSIYGFLLDLYVLGIESGIVAVLYVIILCAIIRDRYISPPDT